MALTRPRASSAVACSARAQLLLSDRTQCLAETVTAIGTSAEAHHPFSSHVARASLFAGKLVWCNGTSLNGCLEGLKLPMRTAVGLPMRSPVGGGAAFVLYAQHRVDHSTSIAYFLAQLQVLAAATQALAVQQDLLNLVNSGVISVGGVMGNAALADMAAVGGMPVSAAAAAAAAAAATAAAALHREAPRTAAMPLWDANASYAHADDNLRASSRGPSLADERRLDERPAKLLRLPFPAEGVQPVHPPAAAPLPPTSRALAAAAHRDADGAAAIGMAPPCAPEPASWSQPADPWAAPQEAVMDTDQVRPRLATAPRHRALPPRLATAPRHRAVRWRLPASTDSSAHTATVPPRPSPLNPPPSSQPAPLLSTRRPPSLLVASPLRCSR